MYPQTMLTRDLVEVARGAVPLGFPSLRSVPAVLQNSRFLRILQSPLAGRWGGHFVQIEDAAAHVAVFQRLTYAVLICAQ